MAEHNAFGESGEQLALEHLMTKGFTLLHKNWRFRKDEIDLVMRDGETLVFVEVKARKNDSFGRPEEFVGKGKQRNLIRAANAYIEEYSLDCESRFDIVAVLLEPKLEINHIPEAFYPH